MRVCCEIVSDTCRSWHKRSSAVPDNDSLLRTCCNRRHTRKKRLLPCLLPPLDCEEVAHSNQRIGAIKHLDERGLIVLTYCAF